MAAKVVSAPHQNGILLLGPGGLRHNEFLANLSELSISQQEIVNKAKKYAISLSIQSLSQKQVLTSQQQQQRAIQRHKALTLMCRVYVGSISFELGEEELKAAFSPYGAVKTISMSWDQEKRQHKGYAFVEFELPEAAQLVLEHMNGVKLGARQIKVGWPSNMPPAEPIIEQLQRECATRNRIYVSNVHPDLTEQELCNLFDPFGKVKSCTLAMTQSQHRGHGFLEFETAAGATDALVMENFDLVKHIHVYRATTPPEHVSVCGTLDSDKAQAAALAAIKTVVSSPPVERQNSVSNNSIDLIRTNEKSAADESLSTSCVLVLRNMVTADEELDDSLQVDIYQECSKYGLVLQVVIYVERKEDPAVERPDGLVKLEQDEVKIFVKYKDTVSGGKAREALDGRFFGGRKISAEEYDRNLFRQSIYSA